MFYVILDMIYVKIKKNDCYILFNDFHILCKCFMLFGYDLCKIKK